MNMYVRYFGDKVSQETDNPTVGQILCAEKNNTILKSSLLNEIKQFFAIKYQMFLSSEKELHAEIEHVREEAEQEEKWIP